MGSIGVMSKNYKINLNYFCINNGIKYKKLNRVLRELNYIDSVKSLNESLSIRQGKGVRIYECHSLLMFWEIKKRLGIGVQEATTTPF